MSEMLTEMVPGQEDSSDLELLQVRDLILGGSCLGGAIVKKGLSCAGPHAT